MTPLTLLQSTIDMISNGLLEQYLILVLATLHALDEIYGTSLQNQSIHRPKQENFKTKAITLIG